MSTFLSLVGEQDQAATLMKYVVAHDLYNASGESDKATADKVTDQLKSQIREKQWMAFVDAVLALPGVATRLFVDAAHHELLSFMRVVAMFIGKLPAAEQLARVQKTVQLVTSNEAKQASLKAALLVAFYNSFAPEAGALRCAIFLALTEHCTAAKLDGVLHDRLKALDSLVASWKVDGATARPLYRAANKLLAQLNNGPAALKQQINFLQTFEAGDAQGQAGVVVEAVEAARQAINLPGAFVVYDVLELGPVQLLKEDSKENRNVLFSLLDCLVHGSMADFEKIASNDAALKKLEVDVEAARTKMRLLTVTTVCCQAIANVTQAAQQSGDNEETRVQAPAIVPLSDVTKALDLKDDVEAEEWILAAISEELVRAKIDQLNSTAVVSYAVHRSFDKKDWLALSVKLGNWSDNVEQLLRMIEPNSNNNTGVATNAGR